MTLRINSCLLPKCVYRVCLEQPARAATASMLTRNPCSAINSRTASCTRWRRRKAGEGWGEGGIGLDYTVQYRI